MKKFKILISLLLLFVFYCGTTSGREENLSAGISPEADHFVSELMSKMTLEEKVGQMTQVVVDIVSKPRKSEADPLLLDMKKLREAIIKYKVGSILNTGGAANSLESWHNIITTIQDVSTKETRLGIPNLYGIDAIHGVNYTLGATLFPQSIAMAATRNRELVKKEGEITAYEMRASGIAWNFNPVLGMGREPLWPRHWETYGEDVYLTTEMGRQYVIGQQGNDMSAKDKVAACLKHYLGYSVPKNGKDRTPAWIPERMLREIFLPPFAAGVYAGAMTVMVNSSEINGIPVHSDKTILTDILKGELGFRGFIISDWEDIKRLHDRDRVAASPEQAVKMAVMAGIDMSMVPHDYSFYNILIYLVKAGEVPESRIDDAVRRILLVKYLTGLFKNPYPNQSLTAKFACKEFEEVNLQAAREAITLLENKKNTLPLKKDINVLVTGPSANLLSVLNGGWSTTWLGNNESLYPKEKQTILEAVQEKLGKNKVVYVQGCNFDKDINIKKAVEEAKRVDAILLCIGEPTYCETPGNIEDLRLYDTQLTFAEKLYNTGKPVILVLVEGRPRVINQIAAGASAVVTAYLPGMEGGRAIADILFGDVNPSGKLPFTYPRSVNGYTCYDYKPLEQFAENKFNPQWPFGHGLSYTTFEYSHLTLNKHEYKMDEKIRVNVTVKNTGQRTGKETVELYICDLYGSVSRPVKQLKGFKKIQLAPNETKTAAFTLDKKSLSFIGRNNQRITEPGEFKVMIKNLEARFVLK
jgi:beta-glucosidase